MHEKIAVPIERYPVDLDADVTYAQVPGWLGRTTRDLKLSVMRPLGVEGPLPCLVWFCGGGWMDCDRNVHLPNLVDIVRAGYVVASAEYRDSNKGDFPMPLEDAKAAVRYLRANAGRWDIDASKIGVAGESAGGHQACLLGVTGDVERFDVGAHLDQTSRVQAVVDYYGVVSPPTAKRDNASHAFDFVYRNLLGAEPEDAPELRPPRRDRDETIVELSIHEGRKRQVKRMLTAVGHPVRQLSRVSFGPITCSGLEEGSWRLLTAAEVDSLRSAVNEGSYTGTRFGVDPRSLKRPSSR